MYFIQYTAGGHHKFVYFRKKMCNLHKFGEELKTNRELCKSIFAICIKKKKNTEKSAQQFLKAYKNGIDKTVLF